MTPARAPLGDLTPPRGHGSGSAASSVSGGWGAYVHFPWCLKKCPYCDFLSIAVDPERLKRETSGAASGSDRRALPLLDSGKTPLDAPSARAVLPHATYADAVLGELAARAPGVQLRGALRSVFFGGGTPSLWDPSEIGRVLSGLLALGENRPSEPGAIEVEITVECNPTSFDVEHAQRLMAAGVNRVSIGVQSLDQERLGFLGRLHDVPGGLRAVEQALRAGMPRVNADLIFGVAGQMPEDAAREVRRVAETGVTHVSAYALTIEPGTQFGALAKRGKLPLLDDERVAESFSAVDETLSSLGFDHYEVSNYARDGHVARHNIGYWRGDDYLGLGTGAWGTVTLTGGQRLRYRNTPSVERYLDAWSGKSAVAEPFGKGPHLGEHEPIDAETALSERILLGLRLSEGLDLSAAAEELGVEAWTDERKRAADRLVARGRLDVLTGGRLVIPKSQWLFADGTIAELL